MQWSQFKSQVEAQGVKLPKGWGGSGGRPGSYVDFAGLNHPGPGYHRDYTDYDVRLAVSWARVHAITGSVARPSKLAERAARRLANHTEGWVVMTNGMVWHQKATPGVHVFDKGAVCLEVIQT